jgi:hypothetical protein
MRPALVWTIGAALIVAAWGVVQLTPDDEPLQAPFVETVEVGQAGVGRAFDATVTDVRLADRVVAGGWAAEGTWLVVDVDAQARLEETGVALRRAALTIDGVTFRASERPASFLGSGLAVGVPTRGSLAFELPDDLLDLPGVGAATLQLGLSDDIRLDSVVELTIDLATLDRESEIELRETGWAS